MASSDDSAHVSVGDGAALTAGDVLTIKAEMAKPTGGKTIDAHAIAGGGGVVSGAVADVRVNVNHETDVSIGENAALKGKTADISAAHQSASALAMESVAAGYYSGTGGETHFAETSDTHVDVKMARASRPRMRPAFSQTTRRRNRRRRPAAAQL